MREIKFNYSLILIVLIISVSFTTGCAPSKYIPPDLPEWALGTIRCDEPATVRIAYIDGVKATGQLMGDPVDEFPDTVIVAPGFHQITPYYITNTAAVYGDPLRFYTQKEQEYVVKHKIKWDKSVKFWVEHKGIDITTEY